MMDWAQIGVLLGVNGVLFGAAIALLVWMRSESRQDYRDLHAIQREDRKDILNLMRSIEAEMKDFHKRLERQDAEFKAHILSYHGEGHANR